MKKSQKSDYRQKTLLKKCVSDAYRHYLKTEMSRLFSELKGLFTEAKNQKLFFKKRQNSNSAKNNFTVCEKFKTIFSTKKYFTFLRFLVLSNFANDKKVFYQKHKTSKSEMNKIYFLQ